MSLHLLDHAVIGVYAVVIAAMSVAASRRQKSTLSYFIAGRSMPAWAVGMALLATLIGSGTVIGHPATVYQRGMILLLGTLTLPVVLVLVAHYVVPFYRNVVRMSAYEYIGARFGLGGRLYASVGFIADRVFDLGVTLLTTAIAVHGMTGWDLSSVILWIGLFTILYTLIGGMEAVVWTSVVQGFIFIGVALLIVGRLVFAPEAGPFGAVVAEAWRGGRFALGNFDTSWSGLFETANTTQWLILLAYMVNWARRYAADQHMVQRYLIARTDRDAARGALWNALLCAPIYMTFMFIGACLYGYYQATTATPPELADNVVPHFIVQAMPAGLVGLFLAAVLSASMSSISADLNSIATVLTTDFFFNFLPESSDRARLRFGKGMVAAGGLCAALVAVLLTPKGGMASVMERGVTIAAIISGGMLGLFCLGFLTTRATRRGCYIGIAACLAFTSWGIITEPTHRLVDLGINFEMNPILIGLLGHLVVFVVGYLASILFGGYRPDNVAQLTISRRVAAR